MTEKIRTILALTTALIFGLFSIGCGPSPEEKQLVADVQTAIQQTQSGNSATAKIEAWMMLVKNLEQLKAQYPDSQALKELIASRGIMFDEAPEKVRDLALENLDVESFKWGYERCANNQMALTRLENKVSKLGPEWAEFCMAEAPKRFFKPLLKNAERRDDAAFFETHFSSIQDQSFGENFTKFYTATIRNAVKEQDATKIDALVKHMKPAHQLVEKEKSQFDFNQNPVYSESGLELRAAISSLADCVFHDLKREDIAKKLVEDRYPHINYSGLLGVGFSDDFYTSLAKEKDVIALLDLTTGAPISEGGITFLLRVLDSNSASLPHATILAATEACIKHHNFDAALRFMAQSTSSMDSEQFLKWALQYGDSKVADYLIKKKPSIRLNIKDMSIDQAKCLTQLPLGTLKTMRDKEVLSQAITVCMRHNVTENALRVVPLLSRDRLPCDRKGKTIFDAAIKYGNIPVADYLLEENKYVSLRNIEPLKLIENYSSFTNYISHFLPPSGAIYKFMVPSKALGITADDFHTLLTSTNHAPVVWLLKNKPDAVSLWEANNAGNFTVLMAVSQGGNLTAAKYLIEDRKVDVHARTDTTKEADSTGLGILAATVGDLTAAADHFEDRKTEDSSGKAGAWPAIIFASGSGNCDLIQYLVDAGANVNASGAGGLTPLIMAVDQGKADAVQLLLSLGADVNAEMDPSTPIANGDKNAYRLAQRKGFDAIVDLLKSAGAK